ncbi:IclR family transcriptional regulator C-terminal domain-containing protein [Streptomyces sp. NPDC005917]|uniref:IclR family transcriptional regulator domain-containing protein n=1 Tax=unclassified Streptomyces TaxID=2593676 RepID=UPI0033D45351
MTSDARAPHFVRSFERGLAVIRAFDAEHPERTLSEVARACDLTRAAARRLLLTLADLGYVHSDGRRFRLTPRILELGYAYLSGLGLPSLAQPHLEQVATLAGESASLCVLDGDAVVQVAAVQARRVMAAAIAVGTRFPAYETAAGQVLLAHQPESRLRQAELIRRQGHALYEDDPEDGVATLAVPVRDRDGQVVAGVTLAAHTGRMSVAAVRNDLLPHLLTAATRIEADLRITRITDRAPGAPLGTATHR